MKNQRIEVDGHAYDTETISEAMLDAIIGRAPVAVMDEDALRDGIGPRLRWALGTVTLIASNDDSDDCIADAADAAAIHLRQAYDMFRALTEPPT